MTRTRPPRRGASAAPVDSAGVQRPKTALPPALWILTAGAFAVGTDAYVMAGVLPDLAHDLHTPISTAGQLVTVYAAVYALLAPASVSITGNRSGRTVLIGALALFTAGSILTATAGSYPAVLIGRVVSAAGAGSFTSQASTAASGLVPPHQRARALAVVISGLTAAAVLGVPLGTMVAGALGWRATLGMVAVLGATALAGTVAWLPSLPPLGKHSLTTFASGLRDRAILMVLIVSLLTATAEQLVYTYVGPALEAVTGGHEAPLSGLLLDFGIGAMVGNSIAGTATERFGSRVTLLLAVGGMTADLALLPWWSRSVPAAVAAMFLWGLTGWMYVVPQQHRILALSRSAGSLAVALNNSVFYLGIAIGGALGGVVLNLANPRWLAAPAVLLGALAITTASLNYREKPPDRR